MKNDNFKKYYYLAQKLLLINTLIGQETAGMRKVIILTIFPVIFLLFAGNVTTVTVVPNSALITGIILEYGTVSSRLLGIQPDQTLYKVTIRLESSEDIDGMPNLLRGKEGEDISFYTKEKLSSDIFDKRVRAEVTYRGDERRGRWWLRSIKILE
jgi:hypothetical protein